MAKRYSAAGILAFNQAVGKPDDEGYQEPYYVIRDMPDRQHSVEVHNGDLISLHFHNNWIDVRVESDGEKWFFKRESSGQSLILNDGQYQARLVLS
jgi:hypothetical protein